MDVGLAHFRRSQKCAKHDTDGSGMFWDENRDGCMYSQYLGRVVHSASSEMFRVVHPADEVVQPHVVENAGEKHQEHQRMLGRHCTGGIRQARPVSRRVERMVLDQPFVRDHRDPDLLLLARANGHHAAVHVEGKAGRLAVRPETVYSRKVEVASPGMVR